MDTDSLHKLAQLIRSQRIASLGTLSQGIPHVSMVPYASAKDFSAFWLHLSGLAFHTRNIHADPHIGLMICEADAVGQDPLALARVSIQSEAVELPNGSQEFDSARSLYLAKFPGAEMSFGLGDFGLYRITPVEGRYVAGFGRTFNLSIEDFKRAGAIP
jgi:heme iron utilization protein